MRTWHIKEAYLVPNTDGIIILRSTGRGEEKINDAQVTIDHMNNCSIVYTNMYWRDAWINYSSEQYDEQGRHIKSSTVGKYYSNIPYSEVEPQYVQARIWEYSTGYWFWRKNWIKNYQITIPGLVRLNLTPTRHTIQSNRWSLEMNDGQINKNY